MFVVFTLQPPDPVRATRILGVEDRRPRQDRHARLQLLDLDLELGLERLEGLDLLGPGVFFRGGCLLIDAVVCFSDRVSIFVVLDDLLVPLVISLARRLRLGGRRRDARLVGFSRRSLLGTRAAAAVRAFALASHRGWSVL